MFVLYVVKKIIGNENNRPLTVSAYGYISNIKMGYFLKEKWALIRYGKDYRYWSYRYLRMRRKLEKKTGRSFVHILDVHKAVYGIDFAPHIYKSPF